MTALLMPLLWVALHPQMLAPIVNANPPVGSGALTAIAVVQSAYLTASPQSATSTLSLQVGDHVFVGYVSGGGSNTMSCNDGLSNTYTAQNHGNDGTIGNTDMLVSYVAHAGTATITCSNTTSSAGELIAMQFRGGASSGSNYLSTSSDVHTGGAAVSVSFSTPGAAVAVQCVATDKQTSNPGTIGAVTGTVGYDYASSSYDFGCQYVIFTTAQTSITAAMNLTTAGVVNAQTVALP